MYTPVKEKRSRRLMTTAYTEHNASRMQLNKSDKPHQILHQQQQMHNLNQRLKFDKLQQSRFMSGKMRPTTSTTAANVTSDFRKDMLDYLNSKFQQVYYEEKDPQNIWTAPKKTYTKTTSHQQIDEPQIKLIFKSYINAIRQLRVKAMSEYFLALILKHTNFISNILHERHIVSLIWNTLNEPTVGQLFIFISILYLHIKHSVRPTLKPNLIVIVQQLFDDLGFKYNYECLQRAYESTLKVLEDKDIKLALLNNRQNRHTTSSLSRHKRRA